MLAMIKTGCWVGHKSVGPLRMQVDLEDAEKWGDIMRILIGHQIWAFAIMDTWDFGLMKSILLQHKKWVMNNGQDCL